VVGDEMIGVAAGDSMAYVTPFEGPMRGTTGLVVIDEIQR
jgi:hypothetical protein